MRQRACFFPSLSVCGQHGRRSACWVTFEMPHKALCASSDIFKQLSRTWKLSRFSLTVLLLMVRSVTGFDLIALADLLSIGRQSNLHASGPHRISKSLSTTMVGCQLEDKNAGHSFNRQCFHYLMRKVYLANVEDTQVFARCFRIFSLLPTCCSVCRTTHWHVCNKWPHLELYHTSSRLAPTKVSASSLEQNSSSSSSLVVLASPVECGTAGQISRSSLSCSLFRCPVTSLRTVF